MNLGDPLLGFLQQWGDAVVFFGSLLEGETVLLLAGLLVHEGTLKFLPVVLLAAAGGFAGDQLFFLLGRRYCARLAGKFPRLQPAMARADRLIERHGTAFILANRFLYGLRLAGPMTVGTSRIAYARYALLDLTGAAIWASVVVSLGFFFGQAARLLLGDLRRFEGWLIAAILLVAALVWTLRRLRR